MKRRKRLPPPPSTPPVELAPHEAPPTNAYYDEDGHLLKKGCAVCGAPNPSFGFGFFPRKGLLGMWYCIEHRFAHEASS